MRVKQKIQINAVVVAASIVLTFGVILVASYNIIQGLASVTLADKIVTSSFERLVLRSDYMRTGSERAKQQVVSKHKQIAELLKSASKRFTTPEDKRTLDALIEGNESIGKIFRAVVENRKRVESDGRPAALAREIEDRFINQLNIRTYEVVMLGGRLHDSGYSALISSFKIGGGAILVVLALTGIAILINSWTMGRIVTTRIAKLRDGATLIGQGNLDQRINLKGDDEFTDLSNVLNIMTARLRESYQELKIEIEMRKEMEEALRRSEEQYRLFFQNSAVGTAHMDMNGRFSEVNDCFCQFTGYSREELLQMTPEDLTHPDDREAERETLAAHLRGLKPTYETEKRYITKDGNVIWVTATAVLVRDSSGRPLRSAAVIQNITDRKRAEEALRAQQNLLDSIVHNHPAALCVIRGSDLKVQLINPAYQAIAPGKDMVGKTLEQTWPEAGRAFSDLCRRVLDTGEPYQATDEMFMLRRYPDGPLEKAFFNWSLYRIQLPGDEGWAILNTANETTQRVWAEEELRSSQRRNEFLANVVNSSSQAFGVGYPDGRIGFINAAFEKLTGYTEKELRSIEWSTTLTPPEWREVEKQKLAELHRNGRSVRYEKEYIRKDGSRVPIELLVHLATDKDGKPEYYYSFINDITERKKAAAALTESEKKYRGLFDNMNEVMAIDELLYDDQGDPVDWRIIDVNPAYLKSTRTSLEDVVGRPAREVYGKKTPESFLRHFSHVVRTGEPVQFESYFEPLAIHLIVSAFPLGSSRFATLTTDITDRKKAEEELRKAHDELESRVQERTRELAIANENIKAERKRFFDVLETLPVYVILLTEDHHMSFANRFFQERFGESDGRHCYEYLFERSEPCEDCETYTVLKTNLPHHWEWIGPDNRNYDIYDYPFVDSDGTRLVLEMGIDITEQKKARQALTEMNASLEQRVSVRTAELNAANETLQVSRVAALNMMEDAVLAHRRAEEANWELKKEIDERKKVEDALQKLNEGLEHRVVDRTRFYSIVASINEAIVHQRDRQSLLDHVCKLIIEKGGLKLAWVGFVDRESREVRPVSSCGVTEYLNGLRIVASDAPEGRGPTGRCIAEGRHAINLDFESDENMKPWRERARSYGIRSSSAFPLRVKSEVIGALTIYSDKPRFFTKEETNLFSALTDDLSFALEVIENEQKRLKAEEDARQAAAETRDLYNNAPCGYHSLDRNGTIVRVNDTELRWIGYSRDEVIGRKISDFYTPDSVRKFNESYPLFVENGAVANLEFDMVRKDGTVFPILLSGTAIRDRNGKFIMSRSTMLDNTERKEIEQRTAIRNALLKLFTQKFSRKEYLDEVCKLLHDWSGCRRVGIRIVNPDEIIPFQACFGFDEDFLKQESDLSLVTDRCICPRIIAGNPTLSDLRSMTPNGSFYTNDAVKFEAGLGNEERSWYRGVCMKLGFRSLTVIPLRYREKSIGSLHLSDERAGLFTQQKVEFLEQLSFIIGEAVFRFGIEEEQMRLASAVMSAADAVVITEPSAGMIQYVNPAFEHITGYRREEVIGRSLHLLDSGKHDEKFFREVRDVIKNEGVWKGRLYNRKKDGTVYLEDCTCSPVKDHSGKIINFVLVKRDVTEKVRLESIAESVNTMNNIGYIFSGVRHEIGNPINSAKMILSVLRFKLEKATKEAIRENIDRTLVEISRVEQLLKNLKNFNLFEKPELQNLNMAMYLKEFLKLILEDFRTKGILVTFEVAPDAEWSYVDPRALQQVLMNLMTNSADALKDTPDPAISITVRKEGGLIHFTVVDNGVGMTDKQLADLYKPFYTSKQNGTGLGLVIVKKMLARMNCDIVITSVHHEGTMVVISMPEGSNG